MDRKCLGIVGLGVMGQNLALNAEEKGFDVVAYDPWEEARRSFAEAQNGGIRIAATPRELAGQLPGPRIILVMVKAGEPVDAVISSLTPYLERGDTLIDGGNSHFLDTIRREADLKAAGFYFIGLGVSGGEEGARRGPSLMAGGEAAAYERARPMLESMAAKSVGEPCCVLLGPDGAGHFIKMMHNGIEYGLMQLISEAYVLMRDVLHLDHAQMAATFREWNKTELSSYLIEITSDILARQDDLAPGFLVERILDRAGQKGTGRWSSEAALALGVPAPTIIQAVSARYMASLKDERVAASGMLKGPSGECDWQDIQGTLSNLHQAVLGGFIVTFAQGLAVIAAAAAEYGWQVDLARTAGVWRNGCVIRSAILEQMAEAFLTAEAPRNLMCTHRFSALLNASESGWRKTVSLAVMRGVPVPALGSSLGYYDAYRSARLWANMVQAQRDYFGAHTYERNDRAGSFHTQW